MKRRYLAMLLAVSLAFGSVVTDGAAQTVLAAEAVSMEETVEAVETAGEVDADETEDTEGEDAEETEAADTDEETEETEEVEETEATEETETVEETEEAEATGALDRGTWDASMLDEELESDSTFYARPADLVLKTTDDWEAFAKSTINGNTYYGKKVQLGADIVFDGTTINKFTPAGEFEGTFDGMGHCISGALVIKTEVADVGVIKYNYGVIKNLTLKNSEFDVSLNKDSDVGGIAEWNSGSILNCAVENVVIKGNGKGYYSSNHNAEPTGGVAGYNFGKIDACRVRNSEISAERGFVGGVAGVSIGTIHNSTVSGSIFYNGQNAEYLMCDDFREYIYGYEGAGGICGISTNGGEVKNCGNMASVKGYYVGGIAGSMSDGTMQNCYNTGILEQNTNADYMGGIAKSIDNSAIISDCYYANTAIHDFKTVGSGVVTRNNEEMAVADMKSADFVNRLNRDSLANDTWIPWEIRSGMEYPQHKPVYAIELGDFSFGRASVNLEYTYEGQQVTFNITPDEYYKVSSVSVKTSSGAAVACSGSNGTYQFTMPAASVNITAQFEYNKPIKECSVTLGAGSYVYDGKAKRPTVTVKDGMTTLREGVHYKVTYQSNVNAGTAKVIVTGLGTYSGSTAQSYTIQKAAQKLTVNAGTYEKVYGDKAFALGAKCAAGPKKITYQSSAPSVASVSAGTVTIKGTGNAVITVTAPGNSNYAAEKKTINIYVSPQKQKISKVTTQDKRRLRVTWKKDSMASGYLVQYSLNNKSWNSTYVGSRNKNYVVLNSLQKGKTYYVRVVAYKDAANGRRYYGEYSPTVRSAKVQEYVTPQIANCKVTLSKSSYTYNKKASRPEVTVKDGSKKLRAGTHYTVKYSANVSAGTAKVKITGKGKYSGSVTKTYKIIKAPQSIKCAKSFVKRSKSKPFKLNAKRTAGDGKLTYKSSNKRVATVSSSGTVTIKGTGKATITVTAKGTRNYKAKSVKVALTVKK